MWRNRCAASALDGRSSTYASAPRPLSAAVRYCFTPGMFFFGVAPPSGANVDSLDQVPAGGTATKTAPPPLPSSLKVGGVRGVCGRRLGHQQGLVFAVPVSAAASRALLLPAKALSVATRPWLGAGMPLRFCFAFFGAGNAALSFLSSAPMGRAVCRSPDNTLRDRRRVRPPFAFWCNNGNGVFQSAVGATNTGEEALGHNPRRR